MSSAQAHRGLVWIGTPPEWLTEPAIDVLDALPVVRELASSRTTDTSIVSLPDGRNVVRKRWRWPSLTERVKGLFRTTLFARSPARREFRALELGHRLDGLSDALRSAPFPELHPPLGAFGPAPIGAADERRGLVLRRCTLLLEEVPNTVDLATWLRDEPDPLRRRTVLRDLARRVSEMHSWEIADRELHPRNVLVQTTTLRTFKVDCPKQRMFRRELPPSERTFDVACLDVGLERFATPRERARALIVYLGEESSRDERRAFASEVEKLRREIAPRESRRLPDPADT